MGDEDFRRKLGRHFFNHNNNVVIGYMDHTIFLIKHKGKLKFNLNPRKSIYSENEVRKVGIKLNVCFYVMKY